MADEPSAPPEPLSLAEVKANLRVDSNDDDALITGLIVDARETVESETGLVLVPRVITETAAELGRAIDLASWPITEVIAIRSPVDGVMTDIAQDNWAASLVRRPVRIVPIVPWWGCAASAWISNRAYIRPALLPVEIDVQAGYATPDDVPRTATRAMHLLIAHWYENRSAVEAGVRAAAIEVPFGVSALCEKLRLARA